VCNASDGVEFEAQIGLDIAVSRQYKTRMASVPIVDLSVAINNKEHVLFEFGAQSVEGD
jgi:hypothetical protein